MQLHELSLLTNKLEEVKELLSNWNTENVKVEFETFGSELVVRFEGNDFDHLVFDLLKMDNSRQVDNAVWIEFK